MPGGTPNATTVPLPIGWGTTVGTVSQPILPANSTRSGLIFINPSSVAVAICPVNGYQGTLGVYPSGPPPALAAVINGAGSVTMQPGDKFIIDNLGCSTAWNGIAAGAGGAITIFEML